MDKKRLRKNFLVLIFTLALAALATMGARKAPRGPRDLDTGIIRSVRCRGRRLDLNLKTPRQTLRLHSNNYFKVDFTAANFTPKGKLNPCREITGMKAKTIFYDIQGQPNEGDLIAVELSK